MSQTLKTNPYWLGDPEFALRAFCDGTVATVPHPLIETDEDAACRGVSRQLGHELPKNVPCDVEQLWARVPRT